VKEYVSTQPEVSLRQRSFYNVNCMEGISVASILFVQILDEGDDNISANVLGSMWQLDILHPVEISTRRIKKNLHIKGL
jgi:hypothetical protein